jgi:hypothetical protein
MIAQRRPNKRWRPSGAFHGEPHSAASARSNQEDKRALKVAALETLHPRYLFARRFPLLGRRVALNDRHATSSLTDIAPQAAFRVT